MAQGKPGKSVIEHMLKDDGFGTLTHTGTAVWAESCDDDEDHHRALGLCHPNFLDCHFYDPRTKLLFHHKYDSDFNTYIEKKKKGEGKIKGVPLVGVFKMPILKKVVLKNGEVVYRESGKSETHPFVNPVYRSIIKMMIGFVVDQHIEGNLLTDFTEKNFVFVGDTLKFVHLGLSKDPEPPSLKANFLCLHKIISRLFQNITNKPREVVDLLSLLEDPPNCLVEEEPPNRTSPGLLMLHSMALMSPKEAVQFFISCNERVQFLSQRDVGLFWSAMRSLKPCDGWSDRFTSEDDDAKFYTDLCFREKKTSYTFESSVSSDTSVKRSLFRCCRNIAVHLKDKVPKDRKLSELGIRLSELGIERMVIAVFYNDLLSLQKALHVHGCLEPFVLNE